MIDPVTGFTIPDEWVSRVQSRDELELVSTGRGVLTASGAVLRRGITTGATAAAAAKAAVLSLRKPVLEVDILLPCGIRVVVPATGEDGRGSAVKDSGDYPEDRTAGLLFRADAVEDTEIILHAGEGIGRFVRDTPRYTEGEPAISPPARDCILTAITEALEAIKFSGVSVTISVIGGRDAGADTLNPRVGVIGGISLLGTTGFVEPWDDHLESSMEERVRSANRVVITTGRIGLRISRLLFPEYEVVLAGSKIGQAIKASSCETILCGLPGLILKFINPDILEGTGYQTVEEYVATEEGQNRMREMLNDATPTGIRIVIVNRDGEVIGDSR
ncbi:MAG: cobalt-precorrin-5B (C(1))-methyltransferase [Methanocalculus sp.]|uniref:cobalt-precorrin-5B (C(1))-methyltransferase n=1 Tax=Methanocalculus sp. TaxID=2004547 RepID=UPI0027258AAF|nr:cobalt-precorrin-5B (C(1))-methyltransferase [Methanocalculus sp.]MDO9539709.1 cobalt-precorrin-5B (C(1))-methyltransferase [Methanocalculus sp.]